MTEPKPTYVTTADKPRAWELEERQETGTFVVARSGALLFRVEVAIGMMYFWDKKINAEIGINIRELPFKLPLT